MDHDRFSRNLPEALTKIAMLEKKYGMKVLATSEALDIDTSDPTIFIERSFKYLLANAELFRIRLLRGAVEVLKALTGQIEAIHNNLDPATLFRIAANFSFRQESLTVPKNFKA